MHYYFQCRYSHFTPSHSMCVVNLTVPGIPMSQADKDAIVSNHNRIRNEVNPPAAGMQKMVRYLLTDIILVYYSCILHVKQ